jgi:hypothetical protein
MIDAGDVIFPKGKVQADLFPGVDDTAVIVQPWIDEGEEKAAGIGTELHDTAVLNWTYYRAFDAVATRMAGEPPQAAADGVSMQISSGRIAYFEKLAQEHLQAFQAILQAQVGNGRVTPSATRSVATRIKF